MKTLSYSRPPKAGSTSGFRWKRVLLGGAIVLVLLLLGGYLWLKTTGLKQILESARVRVLVGQKTAGVLDAPSGYQPFTAQGDTVRSDALFARGKQSSPLTVLEAHDLEARGCWLSGWWQGALHIELLQVGHLRAAYGPAGAKLLPPGLPLPPPPLESATDTPGKMTVVIDRVNVARADVAWGGDDSAAGAILGTKAETVTEGTGKLRVRLTGGVFRQSGWPELPLESATVRFVRPVLRVEEAKLRLPAAAERQDKEDADKKAGDDEDVADTVAGKAKKTDAQDGHVTVAGEARFEGETPLEARLKFADCPVGPLLPARWRARLLGGRFDGETKINRTLRDENTPARYGGSFDARDGTLHGMRMLSQVARITGRKELARLRLRQVRGGFVWDGRKLAVRDFAADAGREKLLRVEGNFEIEDGRIDGTFQLGVTPAAIENIPGARERVFTREEDGYVWTRLRVTGSLDHPHEDLRERLIAAAKAEIASRFLGTLLSPGKAVIKLLEELEDTLD